MKLETLYKLDSKGKVREWDCEVVSNQDGTATIVVVHGLKDGQKITRETLITSGKNIGKANETSPLEQAQSEAKSKWEKQRDNGYINSDKNVDIITNKALVHLPMLAHRYDKFENRINFPAYAQPKLDGIRCLGFHTSLRSRKDKHFSSIPHIQSDVFTALDVLNKSNKQILFLDGELYSPTLSFQEITSIVRKQDPEPGYDKIEYHVYDCMHGKRPLAGFEDRYELIKSIENQFPSIKIVETAVVNDRKELMEYVSDCIARGYEGGIVRNAHGLYEIDKRSYDLQKIKFFNDAEFEIVGGKQDKDGGAVFTCKCGNTTFDVRPEGTLAQRQEYWDNLKGCLGKMLTVRYFEMTTSSDPVPRFPVGVSIRDYE